MRLASAIPRTPKRHRTEMTIDTPAGLATALADTLALHGRDDIFFTVLPTRRSGCAPGVRSGLPQLVVQLDGQTFWIITRPPHSDRSAAQIHCQRAIELARGELHIVRDLEGGLELLRALGALRRAA